LRPGLKHGSIPRIERLVAHAHEAFGKPYRSKNAHAKLRKKIERYFSDPRND
jgi:hypothetical protein